MKENGIILFTRIPAPGKTKTRLQPFLSGEACCLLHRAFLLDIYRELGRLATDCHIAVCYEPDGDEAWLKSMLEGATLYFPQRGSSLGQRMHSAIKGLLDLGCRKCLLIGSDVPLLRAATVDQAFWLLEQRDLSLCPTEDGGYCLIGMKEPCEGVFQVQYGGGAVLQDTLKAAGAAGKTWGLTQPTLDIDDEADLLRLKEVLDGDNRFACGETRAALREIFRHGGGHDGN